MGQPFVGSVVQIPEANVPLVGVNHGEPNGSAIERSAEVGDDDGGNNVLGSYGYSGLSSGEAREDESEY